MRWSRQWDEGLVLLRKQSGVAGVEARGRLWGRGEIAANVTACSKNSTKGWGGGLGTK